MCAKGKKKGKKKRVFLQNSVYEYKMSRKGFEDFDYLKTAN